MTLDADDVAVLLRRLGELAVAPLPITARLLDTAWALHDTVAAPDALCVAAAQELSADLVITDDRLARAARDVAVNPGGDRS
jgi:predicted nucleic acid-binding protein